MKNSFLLFTMLLLTCLSCRKNKDITDITIIPFEDPELFIETSFTGKVVDENGDALQNALVEFGTYSVQADNEGNFEFNKVSAKSEGTLLKASKNGYFAGSALINPQASSLAYTKLTLQEKGNPMVVNTGIGGEVAFPDGHSVKIEPFSISHTNGSIYNGDVYIYAQWLDPTAENLTDIMPGQLFGKDAQGNDVVLATYGMINLALETPDGLELEIANGKTAELKMPIPAELQASAPESMPAWYFDLEAERWAEKGICIKEFDYYICTIEQVAIWNCDIPTDPVFLSGKVFNNDGSAGKFLKICVQDLTTNFLYGGYTDTSGYFGGYVPKDAALQLSVKDLCDNLLFTQEIGPFSADTELDDILLDVLVTQFGVNISGTLKNCNGDPVTFGQIGVHYDGKLRLFPFESNGSFNFSLYFNCSTFPELTITGYDLINRKRTMELIYPSDNDIILGDLTTCEAPEDYLLLVIDGEEYFTAPVIYRLPYNGDPNWLSVAAQTLDGGTWLNNQNYQGVNSYNENLAFITYPGSLNPSYPLADGLFSPNLSMEITNDDGEFIDGTMQGTVYDPQQTEQYEMTLEFKARKE